MTQLERYIWFYWSQGWEAAPWFVKLNYLSWTSMNPEWRAIFLDDENLSDYSSALEIVRRNKDRITITALSDVVRLVLLANKGGAWVDATLLCRTPLELWLPQKTEVSGVFSFRSGCVARDLASWHIAAQSNNYLIKQWLELTKWYWLEHRFDNPQPWIVLTELEKVYCVSRGATEGFFNEQTMNTERVYPYFWVNYLQQRLVRSDAQAAAIWNKTPFAGSSIPSQFLEHNPSEALTRLRGLGHFSRSRVKEINTLTEKVFTTGRFGP